MFMRAPRRLLRFICLCRYAAYVSLPLRFIENYRLCRASADIRALKYEEVDARET